MNNLTRKCPQCRKVKTYVNKYVKARADKLGKSCHSCSLVIHSPSEKYSKSCPECGHKQVYKTFKAYNLAMRNNSRCRVCIGKICGKLSIGRKKTNDSRRKMRISMINRLNERYGKISPKANPLACEFIEKWGRNNGYKFQHALNGGEYFIEQLGYWVDGYDKEKNIVFEYDEPLHFYKNGDLKDKDVRRMNEIKQVVGCQFIFGLPENSYVFSVGDEWQHFNLATQYTS